MFLVNWNPALWRSSYLTKSTTVVSNTLKAVKNENIFKFSPSPLSFLPLSLAHDENRKPYPTEDGYSQSFQVNYFSHFLLTNLLLDLLKKSSPSRVINVTSRLHTAPKHLDFTVGDGNVRYPKLTFYTKGKLANVLFTKEFAKRMEGTGVTSYSVDPGIIFSNIWEKQIAKWKVHVMSFIFW